MISNPKIIICGNYGATNLGDEAILDGILQNIKTAFPKAEITVLSYSPAHTSQRHGINSISLFPMGIRSLIKSIFKLEIIRILRIVKKCDLFILGGGGLFTDERIFAVFLWSWHALLAKFFHKPLYLYAQSIGPLNTRIGQIITRYIFQKAQIITVRDEESADLLKQIGVKIRIQITTDPALSLMPKDHHFEQEKYPYVAINLRPWIKKVYNMEKGIADAINEIIVRYKIKVVLIPFQIKHIDDRKILNKLFAHIKQKEMVEIAFTNDYQEVLWLIKNAKIFITMRLHGVIFAVLTKTPFISLNYSPKVLNFCKMMGFKKYCLDIYSLDKDRLMNVFSEIWENKEKIKQNLEIQAKILSEKTKENVIRLKNFFKNY